MEMIKPDTKKISTLIEELSLDKNNIEAYFIQHKLFDFKERKVKNKNKKERKKVSPVANRTFIGILNGNTTKQSNLEALGKLLTKILKSNGSNRIISLSDLISDQNLDPKNNLRLIRNYNDLVNAGSTFLPQIPFFNIHLKKDVEPLVNNLIGHIDTIMGYTVGNIKNELINVKPIEEERIYLGQYKNELKIISEVNSILEELIEKHIFLYAGDLKNVPELITKGNIREISIPSKDPDIPYPNTLQKIDLTIKSKLSTYKIFNFTDQNYGEFIEVKYKPLFNFEELKQILKKAKTEYTYTILEEDYEKYQNQKYEGTFETYIREEYDWKVKSEFFTENNKVLDKKNAYDFPFTFERPRLTFQYFKKKYHSEDYKYGTDPVLDEYMDRTGKSYDEVMEEGEDQYTQMAIDRIRGK